MSSADKSVVYKRRQKAAPFIRVKVNLATAHTDYEISLLGKGILVEKLDGYLSLKLGSSSGDAISLKSSPLISATFEHLYLSNAAQSGKSATLLVLTGDVRLYGITGAGVDGVYLAPATISAGASSDVWTPDSGKALRLRRLSISTDTASLISLLWISAAWESFYMNANGSIIVNLVGCEEIGAVDAKLAIKSSATATVTARVTGDQIG
jgi:hypothetical protein